MGPEHRLLYTRVLPQNDITRLYGLGATTRVATTLNVNPALANGIVGWWTFDGKDMGATTTSGGAWDLSTATYDTVSKNVSAQSTFPHGVAFKSDGTKMYIIDAVSLTAYQYSLSSAWDLSTATYDTVSKDVSAQTSQPDLIAFKIDGTKMYITSSTVVYQYTLPTPWILTGATYDSVSINVTAQSSFITDVAFKSDGTKMYVVGDGNNTVYQYTLPTPWILTGATYDSVGFSVATQEADPHGVAFKSDGTKMYVSGNTDSVYQYSLGSVSLVATVVDRSGQNNNGTLTGTVAVPGLTGQALSFDGVDDYVATSSSPGSIASVQTIAFWMRISTSTATQKVMNLQGQGTVRAVQFS